jgi:CubicO group peptidase (beta-lactamase class C family)
MRRSQIHARTTAPSRRDTLKMCGTVTASSLAAAEPPALRELLDRAVAGGEVPGLVALIDRGGEVWTHVAGVRDLDSVAPMRRDTVFAVALAVMEGGAAWPSFNDLLQSVPP